MKRTIPIALLVITVGFCSSLQLKAQARETARRGLAVIVAPVFYDAFNPQSRLYDPQVTLRTDAVRVLNLRLLRRHKVHLAFGSDRYGNTPVDDVLYLQRLGVFSNLELLKYGAKTRQK